MHVVMIGCGAVFEIYYLSALQALMGRGVISKVTLCDTNAYRAKAFAKVLGRASTVEDFREVPNRGRKLVIVLTPPKVRTAIIDHFSEPEVSFACEKPLAISKEQASCIYQKIASRRQWFSMLMVRRHFGAAGHLKKYISSSGPVRILWVEGGRFDWPIVDDSVFLKKKGAVGGVIFDKGSHVLDLLCDWDPSIRLVRSVHNGNASGVDNRCQLRVAGQKLEAEIRLSWVDPYRNCMVITDSAGPVASWDLDPDGCVDWHRGGLEREKCLMLQTRSANAYSQAIERQLEETVLAASEQRPPPVEISCGAKVVELCEAAVTINL